MYCNHNSELLCPEFFCLEFFCLEFFCSELFCLEDCNTKFMNHFRFIIPMDVLEEKFRKIAPVDDSADLLWLLYLSGDSEERKQTDELLDVILHQKAKKDFKEKVLLDPGGKNDCDGEYSIGTVIYPDKRYAKFGLREHEWLKHILITGMTGTGKTNLCFQILCELKKKGKPFLVFDWKKNYRDLVQLPELRDTKIYTIGSSLAPLFFNPLIPPEKTDPGMWLVRLIDIIKHAYFLGDGVEYLMRDGIEQVYEKCGMYDDATRTDFPVFSDVEAYISKLALKGRMSLWKASTMRALSSLTFKRGLGISLEHRMKANIDELLKQNVVIELDPLSNNDKIFFIEALILWIYEYRKNDKKREKFKHALLIEEGHHILSNQKQHNGEETIIETMLRQIREFGEAVIVVDQEPSKLSNSIKANTFCKMTFNLGNGRDILDMAKCMMLNSEEVKYIDLLDVGQAIVKLKGRVFKPMFVVLPFVSVNKGKITDELLIQDNKHVGYPPEGVKNGVDC